MVNFAEEKALSLVTDHAVMASTAAAASFAEVTGHVLAMVVGGRFLAWVMHDVVTRTVVGTGLGEEMGLDVVAASWGAMNNASLVTVTTPCDGDLLVEGSCVARWQIGFGYALPAASPEFCSSSDFATEPVAYVTW